MNLLKSLIFAFFFIILPAKSGAKINSNLQFSQISTKDGLSQNTVRTILEDKKGFIWAGTLDGLNRYDGYSIITYKPQLNNPNSLIDHRIKNVFQDKDGYLWIKTYKNEFSCYNPVLDSFIDYHPTSILNGNIYFVNYFEASNGEIWLWGNENGYILRINKNGEKFISKYFLTERETANKKNCKFLIEDSKSVIWVGGESGLFTITGDKIRNVFFNKQSFINAIEINDKIFFITEKASVVEYDTKRKSFIETVNYQHKNIFTNVAKLSNHELLIVTKSSGLISYNLNSKLFEKPGWTKDPQLKGDIEYIIDKNQGIWIYNHSGIVWYYNQKTQKVKKMELIPASIAQIIDLERYNVFIDSKGIIWITTYGNGLFCYNSKTGLLQNYKYSANKNSPASDYLLSITEDKYGNMWIGSEYAGIIKVIKSNYNIQVIHPEDETSIGKNNNVRTIQSDAFNKIWVGTKNGSLYVYDNTLSTGKCIYKNINPYAFMQDAKKRMWVGTKGKGLYIIDMATYKETAHYTNVESDINSLSNNTIFSIYKDTKNRVWVGTFGGGINLTEETDKGFRFRHFFLDDGNRSYIRYIYQDRNGKIWAASSDGIIFFDPEELIKNPKAYKTYRMDFHKENSINCNDIKTIFEDKEGIIWIGTAGGGLNKYVPATANKKEHFVAYTIINGLSGDFVIGILEDKERNLWISTESGITKFNKNRTTFTVYQFSEKIYGNQFNENAIIYYNNSNILLGSLDGLLAFNPGSFVPDQNTPPVTLTDFSIYDVKVQTGKKDSPLKRSISYSDKIELNYKQNTFTIEFSSLALKYPQKNKYVYILEDYDNQWSSVSNYNKATYKNLSPGKYIFKVKGANSDGIWNNKATQIEIIITPPFWKSWYAYMFYSLLLAFLLYTAFKIVRKFDVLNHNIKLEKELTNHKLRFFTNISHEFRTPLTLIRGAIENLNEQTGIPPESIKQINTLGRNSAILTRLIDQLLEFRKIQNNVLRLDLEEINIIDFSKDIYISFQEAARKKKIEYLFVSDTEFFNMLIDRRKLDKILYNLLSNAFKFTPVGGKIELAILIDSQKQTCTINIKDNGVGIEKEKQSLLFKRFMQTNFSFSGTGIGLSLVKEFVNVHKGKVWFEENAGRGSVFYVELSTNPDTYKGENFIASSDSEAISTEGESKILYPSDSTENVQLPELDSVILSNYRMLIIDDNDDIRNFLFDEFSKYLMVEMAEDGQKGLEKAIEINPDLIICDVMMPVMDGFEVIRLLKGDFQTCHIPIILLTAHSSLEHQLEGIQSGADAYIMKPFSLKYLVARVFKLIEQREQLKKRFSNEYVLDGNLITSTDQDKEFFNMIDKILEEHIADSQFSIDKFAELAKQRRTIFYKKVKGITGFPPNELIKIKRLKRAAELLLQKEFTVSEISYKVGFDDPFYFSKCFKMHFKCSPSKYGQPINQNK